MKPTTITTLAGLALASSLGAQGTFTSETSYLVPTPTSNFTFTPVITTGDLVNAAPGAPGGATKFGFCGIPDAMGLYKDRVTNQNILFVAHEYGNTANSRPFLGQTRYKGAWVSRFVVDGNGGIINGAVAHKDLYAGNTFIANRPPLEGDATGFSRFCSGSLANVEHGMDRPLFFTNEESGAGSTYDAAGPLAVVVADGAMYTLPALGRMARENTVVQPRRDAMTVVMMTEDGPAAGNVVSYVYMYVGTKQRRSASVLDKNGLNDGKIYVMAGRDAQHNEGTFTSGSLPIKWVEIPGAAALNSTQISAAADLAGGFGLIRVEDEEFDPTQPTRSLFFTTTGGSLSNPLGRLYEVTMNPTNPLANGTLNVIYNAADIVTPGGTYSGASVGKLAAVNGVTGALGTYSGGNINAGTDFAVSADNIAISKDFIVVCEDTNSPANAVYAKYGRTSGTWTLNRNNNYAPKLQCTYNYAYTQGRDQAVAPAAANNAAGLWETSGVINTDAIFGAGTFLINVQGHLQSSPNGMRANCPDGLGGAGVLSKAQAVAAYVEDGQVILMKPAP